MSLLAKLLISKISKRLRKSATAAVGTGIVVAGGAFTISPQTLELIPEQYRSYALVGIGALVLLARVRTEIMEAIRQARE